jgi:hypothetical protein
MRARGRAGAKPGAKASAGLRVEQVALQSLKPDPGKARRHSAASRPWSAITFRSSSTRSGALNPNSAMLLAICRTCFTANRGA